ncbi:MAG: ABC transporter permease [Bacteroidaceae bacterium]|nr:ABC transporter permease [Bacteroidaceae bacterium]
MNLPFYIAKRYLFTKKSHSAINIISVISVLGVMVAVVAMVCTLSVFNGFQDLVASCFTNFDPQLKVVPTQGKTFSQQLPEVQLVREDEDVDVACGVLEDRALARYGDRQAMITLMGAEDDFDECTDISSILYGNGRFALHADVLDYGILGIRLAMYFNMGVSYQDPLLIYTPRKGAEIDMMDPSSSFNQDELNSAGVVFSVNQKQYDQEYVLTSLSFAQRMFERPGQFSALELRLAPGANVDKVKKRLQQKVGKEFRVMDRYEQQADVFRIMKVEKYMSYLFLSFILFIACFNIVGSLSMLIIDKRDDVRVLHHLGAGQRVVARVFLYEGRMISIVGASLGILIGLLLCWMQQHYGLLRLGDVSGAFIVDAYPVSVHVADVVLIFLTVIGVAFITTWYPVHYLSRKLTD